MRTVRNTLVGFGFVFAVMGCSAAIPSPSPTSRPPDAPISTDGPSSLPGDAPPADGAQPTFVAPRPGQQSVHDVSVEQLSAKVAGRHVVLNARWWSGVEPCSVLDSVAVTNAGGTIKVAVREGSSARDVACIDIAMLKVTAIDLGDLEPGAYTVVASQGSAPGIAITVR
jgi:hypothetical protein